VDKEQNLVARYEAFTVVKIQIEVFWFYDGPLNRWYLTTTLQDVTTQKSST